MDFGLIRVAKWFSNDTCYISDCCFAIFSNVATFRSSKCNIDEFMLEEHILPTFSQTKCIQHRREVGLLD